MAVFKVNKNNNYTVISNTHLKERKMTLKAKGLLTLMLSLPPDWDYSIEGLIFICVEGERAINSTLNELKEFGYLRIEKLPPRKGKNQFEYIYNIYEKPLKKEERQLKNVEVQNVGLQNVKLQSEAVQNQGQLNTNTLSTKELNTKLLNTYSLFMEKWNELAKECELSLIKSFTENRRKKLSELLEKFTQEEILETMFKIKNINFLLGRTDKSNWKISFDDFLNEEKFIKILEGAYYDEVKSTGRKQDKKIAKPKSAGAKKEYGF